jgi:hypothetical protein
MKTCKNIYKSFFFYILRLEDSSSKCSTCSAGLLRDTGQQKVVTGGNELVYLKNNTSVTLRYSKSGSSTPDYFDNQHVAEHGFLYESIKLHFTLLLPDKAYNDTVSTLTVTYGRLKKPTRYSRGLFQVPPRNSAGGNEKTRRITSAPFKIQIRSLSNKSDASLLQRRNTYWLHERMAMVTMTLQLTSTGSRPSADRLNILDFILTCIVTSLSHHQQAFARKRSLSNRDTNPPFAWTDWGKP